VRTRPCFPLIVFLIFSFPSFVQADVLHQTFEFSTSQIRYSTSNGYDQIYLDGCNITDDVGHPQLPVKTIHLALPPASLIEKIEIVSTESEYLPGTYRIFPAQPPRILSADEQGIVFVLPDSNVYASAKEYPGRLAEPAASGGLGGYQLAGVKVYPLQYEPQSRRAKFFTKIEAAITYTTDGSKPLAARRRDPQLEGMHRKLLNTLVANPEQAVLNTVAPALYKGNLPPEDVEYLIITSSSWVSRFTPLAEWKTKKGVPAKIVTTSWIYANYNGSDRAEQLRNFIKDAYQSWGVVWVLLGGDWWVTTGRYAWAMDVEYGGADDENDIPTDLYFADLDGSWDDNLNGTYGEVDDNVDLYPEVFVGRASCDGGSEVTAWVNKLIAYETNPPTDYQLNMGFFAEVLWSNPYTDAGEAKNLIDDLYIPPRFDPITKLYQSLGNESAGAVIDALNAGQNIVNHDGHCWIDYMSMGSGGLTGWDMDNLVNGSRQTSFLFSIGCWPAAYDYDCVAEHFITNPNGGGVAFVGNSRYGWGSPGNSEYGYSDRFDQQLFKAIFIDSLYNLGAALAKCKAVYVPHSHQENVYRWCMYQTNLLGDPEMPVWTDIPQQFFVHHPNTIPSAGGEYNITVTTADTSRPVAGAMVCLLKENDLYERALTGPDGTAQFAVTPTSDGMMSITVTAHNFIPYQGEIVIGAGGTYVDYKSHTVDDTAGGNGDGLINPGETVDIWMTVENHGPGAANNLTGFLYSRGDAYVTLIDSALSFGDVPAGAVATSSTTAALSIDPGCPDGHVALFDWLLTDAGAQSFSGILSLQVGGTVLSYYRYLADDPAGNGNHLPEPGETCELRVWVDNSGLADASQVSVELSTSDPMITITGSPSAAGDIAAGDWAPADFTVDINPACPSPHFVEMHLDMTPAGGQTAGDIFIFTVGSIGFFDDMESGALAWAHGGAKDRWTLTDHRCRSGSTAWYCGNTGSWHYEDNMNCWLEITPVVLGPDSRLTFWDWFLVPNYGVDGCHVIVTDLDLGGVDTLDFIGTGGALDSTLRTGNEWTREFYDLSSYPAGTRLGVRINFSSDNDYDIEEGFYIDDVRIESRPDYDIMIEPTFHLLWGGEGDTIVQRLRVENAGFWEDSFALTLSGSVWDVSFWNADGTEQISQTGPISPGAFEQVLLQVVILNAPAGTADTVILTATSVNQPERSAYAVTITTTEGGKGTIPWLDRFSTSQLNIEQWPVSSGVSVRSDLGLVPSPPYALDLDAGGSLFSQRIDLSAESGIRLAFWYRGYRTSNYSWYGPCNFYFDYLSADNMWVNMAFLPGATGESPNFDELIFLLPTGAYHDRFRVRLRAYDNIVGHWYLDDVYIGPPRDYHFVPHASASIVYEAEGEVAVHYISIENRGVQIDQYHLSVESGNWLVSFWDDFGEISLTEPIPPGNTVTVEVRVTIPVGSPVLAADTTLILVASDGDADERRYSQFYTMCIGEVASFPWQDDFPEATLLIDKWPLQMGVGISSLGQDAPSPPYTMRVNFFDTVLSQKIDLSTTPTAMLDFYSRAGQVYTLPGEKDSIFFEFYGTEGSWERVRALNGGGLWKDEFFRYCDTLPASARHRGFQLRIRAQMSSNNWYLDNIRIVLPPSCAVSPAAVGYALKQFETATATVTIDNLGPGELEYQIEIIPSDILMANLLARQGHGDWLARTGVGVLESEVLYLCDLGGPDDYGYMWTDSDEPYGPVFAWEDISGYGQELVRLDNVMYDTMHLNFAFPYYDTSYTELLVSCRGALQFGPASGISHWGPIPIPHYIAPNNVLLWCWGNHNTLGTVYAHSTVDRAVIQFNGFGDSTDVSGRCATAQVELSADGMISYRYLEFGDEFPTKDCSVGIENQDGSDGLGVVIYVNPVQEDPRYLHDGLQIDFYPPVSWISVDPSAGSVASGGTQPLELDFHPNDLALGTYGAVLRVLSNDPDTAVNPFYVTARLTVTDESVCYCPLGDVNLDGQINPVDITLLVIYVYLSGTPTASHPQCLYNTGDIQADGEINPIDVVLLLQYVYFNGSPPADPCTW